jgi:hypothetical protein
MRELILILIFISSWVETESTAATSGLLYQPLMMMMNVEQSMEWELEGETEVLGENLPQCHFVHHKFHMTWPGLETEPPRWEAGD